MATATPREQMNDAAQSAKDAAQATLGRQKDSAASTLGSLADTLRQAARESDGDAQGAGNVANWAADGLERVSSTLRDKDLGGMLRDVEGFARRQPVAFFLTAAAVGFLATRFLKAGAGPENGQSQGALVPAGGEDADTNAYYPTTGM